MTRLFTTLAEANRLASRTLLWVYHDPWWGVHEVYDDNTLGNVFVTQEGERVALVASKNWGAHPVRQGAPWLKFAEIPGAHEWDVVLVWARTGRRLTFATVTSPDDLRMMKQVLDFVKSAK